MDLGPRVSYKGLTKGTTVFSRDHQEVGTVVHVLSADDEDVFDGIVIDERLGPGGHHFADADDVEEIYEGGVVLRLSRTQSEQLPEPSENPATMSADPSNPPSNELVEKLRRAWAYVSGDY